MKQKIKGLLSVALCFVLIIQSANINAATKVKINKTKASIYVGKTVQLKVTGTKKKVTWKSSNKKVATVTSKGKVKGVKKGTAKITATVSKKKYVCKVTVKNKETNVTTKEPEITNEPVKDVSITPTPTPTETPCVISLGGLQAYNYNEEYTLDNGCKITMNGMVFSGIDHDFYKYGYVDYLMNNDTDKTVKVPTLKLFMEDGSYIYTILFFDYLRPYQKGRSNPTILSFNKRPVIIELVMDRTETETYKDALNPNAMHWIVDTSKK